MKEDDVKRTLARVRETVTLCEQYVSARGSLSPKCQDALNHMVSRSLKLQSKPRTWFGRLLLSIRISWIEKFDEEIRQEIFPSIKS